jgi:hypothetical protein
VVYVTFRHERPAVGRPRRSSAFTALPSYHSGSPVGSLSKTIGPATPPASTGATHPIPRKMAGGQGTGSRHKICKHGCRRTLCRTCGGRSLCVHQNQRNHCPACRNEGIKKGKSYCKHNRQKSRCVKCNGVGICEHRRERYRCSLCKAKELS